MKKTQLEVVREMLQKEGHISNVWAFQHYILRLGAIIHTLRHDEGMEIETLYENKMGFRNCIYYLKSERK